MDKKLHRPESPKAGVPGKEGPVRDRGYSGRGAAAALETLKKLERVKPTPDKLYPLL